MSQTERTLYLQVVFTSQIGPVCNPRLWVVGTETCLGRDSLARHFASPSSVASPTTRAWSRPRAGAQTALCLADSTWWRVQSTGRYHLHLDTSRPEQCTHKAIHNSHLTAASKLTSCTTFPSVPKNPNPTTEWDETARAPNDNLVIETPRPNIPKWSYHKHPIRATDCLDCYPHSLSPGPASTRADRDKEKGDDSVLSHTLSLLVYPPLQGFSTIPSPTAMWTLPRSLRSPLPRIRSRHHSPSRPLGPTEKPCGHFRGPGACARESRASTPASDPRLPAGARFNLPVRTEHELKM